MTDQESSETIDASNVASKSEEESEGIEKTVRMLAAVRLLLRQLRERME
ncbi:MAG: hypothetical protein IT293_16010 [Deltaproteobacteria bacterium]|nr:hypothetical protein [Deltaproteobacteria bacterium]